MGLEIREGFFGGTRLDGVRLVRVFSWPGAIHEGNGTRLMIIDEATKAEQRSALAEMESGRHGGGVFEIFAAVCPNVLESIVAPITLAVDRERRQASLRIPGIAESRIDAIRNPVTGEEHRAKIHLPNGFEYKEAEMGNSVSFEVIGALAMRHENTYAQLNAFDWSDT
jgi:hypothetical protein